MFVSGNGVVSMVGNLALMPGLVDVAGLPPVVANVVAVAICGVVNYRLGDRVCFSPARVVTEES
jgi:putative flippase GtrA